MIDTIIGGTVIMGWEVFFIVVEIIGTIWTIKGVFSEKSVGVKWT